MSQIVIALVHEEDGAFGISFPDFPGCISAGDSLEEAVERGAATVAFHVAGMVEDGDALPTLRTLSELRQDPVFQEDADGALAVGVPMDLPGKEVRINITLEEHLLTAVDRAAAANGQSRSGFLADAAQRRLRGAVAESDGIQKRMSTSPRRR